MSERILRVDHEHFHEENGSCNHCTSADRQVAPMQRVVTVHLNATPQGRSGFMLRLCRRHYEKFLEDVRSILQQPPRWS